MSFLREILSKLEQWLDQVSARIDKKFHLSRPAITPNRPASRTVLVIIHGAGSFPEDWYKPTVDAIAKELGRPFDFIPVYFADLANRPLGTLAETPEKSKFKMDFQKELEKSFAQARSSSSDRVDAAALPAPIDQIVGTVRLVADYFFAPTVRTEIQTRLITKMNEAAIKFDTIVLVAHSLGSIVAFDVLKQSADRYNISLWFTTGSAIAKMRRIGIYDDRRGAITSQNIKHWYNIYDTTDWIADPLGPAFPQPGYRLFDIFVDIGVDPNASHDYLLNPEAIKLFADALR